MMNRYLPSLLGLILLVGLVPAQAVVDVRDARALPDRDERVQQRHRVGAARDRDEDGCGPTNAMLAQKLRDVRVNGLHTVESTPFHFLRLSLPAALAEDAEGAGLP